jgi:hypothetical protein
MYTTVTATYKTVEYRSNQAIKENGKRNIGPFGSVADIINADE